MLEFINFISPAILGVFLGILLIELKWILDYCSLIGRLSSEEETAFIDKMVKGMYVAFVFGVIGIALIIIRGVLAGA